MKAVLFYLNAATILHEKAMRYIIIVAFSVKTLRQVISDVADNLLTRFISSSDSVRRCVYVFIVR